MSRAHPIRRALFGVAFVVAPCLSCATKSLPPGTPPPEYEKRSFEPWPPGDAGVDAGEPAAAPGPVETVPIDAGGADGAEALSEPPPPL
jgi:hypothetical protein